MHCFLPEGFYHDASFVRLIIGGGDPGGTAMRFMIHGPCSCHSDSERYILLVLGTIPTRFGMVWYCTIPSIIYLQVNRSLLSVKAVHRWKVPKKNRIKWCALSLRHNHIFCNKDNFFHILIGHNLFLKEAKESGTKLLSD